jgi:DNA polymerase III alpha subunit
MTMLPPVQVFSAAAVGMGINTPDQLAEKFKILNYKYFPLSNTGVMTDILAHEEAAHKHGLIPIYGRTITFNEQLLHPITLYAKNQVGRDWLYQQAVEYEDIQAFITALMGTPPNSVAVFFPSEWLNTEATANVVLCSKGIIDTYCVVDARQSINTLSMGVSQYPLVLATPVNYTHAREASVFEKYRTLCKKSRHQKSLAYVQMKASYAGYRVEKSMCYMELAKFLSETQVEMDGIFDGFESIEPLRKVAGRFNIDPNITLNEVKKSLKNALKFKHSSGELHRLSESHAPVSLAEYEDRLKYELSLFAKADRNIELFNLFTIRRAIAPACKLRGARGSFSGLLICYLLGLTIIDPLANNIAPETIFAKKNFKFNFELPSDVREGVFELMEDAGNVQPVKLYSCYCWQPRSILRALIKDRKHSSEGCKLEELSLCFKRYPTIVAAEELYKEIARVLGDESVVYKIMKAMTGLPMSYGEHNSTLAFVPDKSAFSVTAPSGGDSGVLCLGLSSDDIRELDLPRCDILGLTVIDDLCEMFNSDKNKINCIAHIRPNDKHVIAQISGADVRGLMPIIPKGCLSFVRDTPETLRDVANQLALTRETTMLNGKLQKYLERRPDAYPGTIKTILEPTRGVLIYQQQALRIIRDGVNVPGLKAANAVQCLFEGDNEAYLDILKGYKSKSQCDLITYVLVNSSSLFCEAHAMYYAKLIYMSSYFLMYARTEYVCNQLNHLRTQHFTLTEMLNYLLILINMGVKIGGVDKNTQLKRVKFTVKDDVIVPEGYSPILTPEDIASLKELWV